MTFCVRSILVPWLLLSLPLAAYVDGPHPDPGYLQQTVLVIVRFPPEGISGELTAPEENHIITELDAASDFLWTNSNQSLRVQFHRIKFEESPAKADYKDYGTAGAAAMYTSAINQSLAQRHVDPRQYAGIMMIYRPTNAPGGLFNNTWVWYNDELSSHKRNPGFSSIPYDNSSLLHELVVHEYLHQLDHRFEKESGNPEPIQHGFMNPDNKDAPDGQTLAHLLSTTFPTPVAYYQAMLKYYVGKGDSLHAVNYRWLEGIRGVFNGGELKAAYNFGRPDDALIHASGDNIAATQPGNPVSFWFRAASGHTAAFRTQTGFGRYILRQVAFNYEIAPGDYTFEVHLVYYDNKGNVVDQRIDDGSFVLGRQKFRDNRKMINVNREVEDFQIVFRKGNQLSGAAASDDWLLLGNITLDTRTAP
jgi:hypothetical protein